MSGNMSKEEIENKIVAIDRAIFFLEMKDHWDNVDRNYYAELCDDRQELKKKLGE